MQIIHWPSHPRQDSRLPNCTRLFKIKIVFRLSLLSRSQNLTMTQSSNATFFIYPIYFFINKLNVSCMTHTMTPQKVRTNSTTYSVLFSLLKKMTLKQLKYKQSCSYLDFFSLSLSHSSKTLEYCTKLSKATLAIHETESNSYANSLTT